MELNNLRCCGVKEIAGLSYYTSGAQAIKQFGDLTYYRKQLSYDSKGKRILVLSPVENFRYVMFTQAVAPLGTAKYGDSFAAYITKHKLGTLVETPYNNNPNSGNNVKVWIWTVDHVAVKALLTKLHKQSPPDITGIIASDLSGSAPTAAPTPF